MADQTGFVGTSFSRPANIMPLCVARLWGRNEKKRGENPNGGGSIPSSTDISDAVKMIQNEMS